MCYDLPIGTVLIAGKVKYVVVEDDKRKFCAICDFCQDNGCVGNNIYCSKTDRADKKDIVFKKVEE